MNRPKKKTPDQLAREGLNYSWMTIGTPVNFHSIINGPPTKATTIRHEPYVSASDSWVCFVDGVSGYVLCEAVTFRKVEGGAA